MIQQKVNKSLIIVARQAGTANSFLPLFDRFRDSDFSVKTFAFIDAHKQFASHNIDATLIAQFNEPVLNDVAAPFFLLTGTSEFADEDFLFWQWAKSRKIPSLAFVDSWISYWQRFTPRDNAKNRFAYTPDTIAVIDRLMFEKMVENGCDNKQLIITGSPVFDGLQNYISQEQENIERKYGKDYLLFIGEPFNIRLFSGSEKETRGYTEVEVLNLTVNVLKLQEFQKYKLIFRPHPRVGCTGEIKSIIDYNSNCYVDDGEFTAHDLVACSKAVVGMTSMLLFEASVMGVPVISIQPDKKQSSDLIDFSSQIPVVTTARLNEVSNEMHSVLFSKPVRTHTAKSTLYDEIFRCLPIK